MAAIQRNSPIPMYYQVAQDLRARIFSGELGPGSEIPSERELQESYSVSRYTVRQAANLLVSEGLVRREQGRRSYVLPEGLQVRSRIDTFFEHWDMIKEFGFQPSVQYLETLTFTPEERMRESLELGVEDCVVCFKKMFLADGVPAILAMDHVAENALREPFNPESASQDYFHFLEEAVGQRVEYLLSDIEPVAADAELAALFRLQPGAPLLLLRELYLDSTQKIPLQYTCNYHNHDIIRYSILRRRRQL